MRINRFALAMVSTIASVFMFTGCSTSFAPSPGASARAELGPVNGQLYGGNLPIVGAHIYAYGSSTLAYGGNGIAASAGNASSSLITATPYVTNYQPVADGSGNNYVATDSNGAFEISASTPCTSGTVVYLYSVGGDPGGGANTNASEMAVLGICPASGLLINALTPGTSVRIYMNEVSTVAAGYALAGFATDSTHIGALTTVGGVVTDTLAQTGIQNAGANAAQLYTAVATSGSSNGTSRAANATTPNGNGTVPQATLDSIANVLAACINGTTSSAACTTLFNDDCSGGGTSGTPPTDTATAAIYLAQHPYSTHVGDIFNLVTNTGHFFTPDLGAATPNDFSISLVFTGGGLTLPTVANSPRTLSVDASGNLWNANYTGNSLSEFNPLGVPVSSTGYTGNGLSGPLSTASDTSGDIWVANSLGASLSVFNGAGGGAVAKYSSGLGLTSPADAELDASNNVFVADSGGNTLVKVSSTGGFVASTTASGKKLNQPDSVTLEPGTGTDPAGTMGEVWAANSNDRFLSEFGNNLTSTSGNYYPVGSYTVDSMIAVAIDGEGYVWATVQGGGKHTQGLVAKVSSDGSSISTYTPGSNEPNQSEPASVAIDGAGNAWITDSANGAIYEVSNAGTTLSGTYGFIAIGNSNYAAGAGETLTVEPNSIAVDGSGDVWYTTTTDTTLRELIGASAPVVTPIAYAVKNKSLGARP